MARQKSQPTLHNPHETTSLCNNPGTLFIIGTPIGSFDDLSLRAINTLKAVSIIAAEHPLVTQSLLSHHGIATQVTSYGPYNREEKIAVLLHHLRKGENIALVSDSGMPVIFDPGRMLVASAQQEGYPVTVIPGPSAVTAAVALSGYSGDHIVFEGRVPRTNRLREKFLRRFTRSSETLILYISPKSCPSIIRSLIQILPKRQVTIAIDLTKPGELVHQDLPSALLKQASLIPKKSEVTVVIEGKK